jgi:hypothetical protein
MYSKGTMNTSIETLNAGRSKAKVVPVEDANDLFKQEKRKARNEGLSHLLNNDYKPASYKRAVQFRDSMSYKKKIS